MDKEVRRKKMDLTRNNQITPLNVKSAHYQAGIELKSDPSLHYIFKLYFLPQRNAPTVFNWPKPSLRNKA